MKSLVKFMASPTGRGLRVLVGVAIIYAGYGTGGLLGSVLMVIGVVPILAGIFNWCFIAPLFGFPFKSAKSKGGK